MKLVGIDQGAIDIENKSAQRHKARSWEIGARRWQVYKTNMAIAAANMARVVMATVVPFIQKKRRTGRSRTHKLSQADFGNGYLVRR